MNNPTDLKMQLIRSIRGKDVELSEDLYRRMGPCTEINQLNSFFHGMISQYQVNTMHIRLHLVVTESYEDWYTAFSLNVLPFLIKKRLPMCTNQNAGAIYGSQPKSL